MNEYQEQYMKAYADAAYGIALLRRKRGWARAKGVAKEQVRWMIRSGWYGCAGDPTPYMDGCADAWLDSVGC